LKFKTGKSPDIETIKKKTWSFSIYIIIIIINEVFLKSLRWAGHPILRPFFRKKTWSISKNLKIGRSPDIKAII